MRRQAIELFDANKDMILEKAGDLFGFSTTVLRQLGSFESVVYETVYGNRPMILRITNSGHRCLNEIDGELEWINYLAEGGVSVCRALPSRHGNLVEAVYIDTSLEGDRSYFSLSFFEKAEGKLIEPKDWCRELFVAWGQTIGRIHTLSRRYRPSRIEIMRPHWHEDDDIQAYKALPEDQSAVVVRWQNLLTRMHQFQTNNEIYGLVHDDIHHGNIFMNNGSVTVFDFDDCRYHWYVNDLAISLFYLIQDKASGQNKNEFARRTLGHFLEGYYRENDLPRSQLAQIGDFLKFREIMLYLIIHEQKLFDADDWCRRYLMGRQAKIENNIPFVDIDFSDF